MLNIDKNNGFDSQEGLDPLSSRVGGEKVEGGIFAKVSSTALFISCMVMAALGGCRRDIGDYKAELGRIAMARQALSYNNDPEGERRGELYNDEGQVLLDMSGKYINFAKDSKEKKDYDKVIAFLEEALSNLSSANNNLECWRSGDDDRRDGDCDDVDEGLKKTRGQLLKEIEDQIGRLKEKSSAASVNPEQKKAFFEMVVSLMEKLDRLYDVSDGVNKKKDLNLERANLLETELGKFEQAAVLFGELEDWRGAYRNYKKAAEGAGENSSGLWLNAAYALKRIPGVQNWENEYVELLEKAGSFVEAAGFLIERSQLTRAADVYSRGNLNFLAGDLYASEGRNAKAFVAYEAVGSRLHQIGDTKTPAENKKMLAASLAAAQIQMRERRDDGGMVPGVDVLLTLVEEELAKIAVKRVDKEAHGSVEPGGADGRPSFDQLKTEEGKIDRNDPDALEKLAGKYLEIDKKVDSRRVAKMALDKFVEKGNLEKAFDVAQRYFSYLTDFRGPLEAEGYLGRELFNNWLKEKFTGQKGMVKDAQLAAISDEELEKVKGYANAARSLENEPYDRYLEWAQRIARELGKRRDAEVVGKFEREGSKPSNVVKLSVERLNAYWGAYGDDIDRREAEIIESTVMGAAQLLGSQFSAEDVRNIAYSWDQLLWKIPSSLRGRIKADALAVADVLREFGHLSEAAATYRKFEAGEEFLTAMKRLQTALDGFLAVFDDSGSYKPGDDWFLGVTLAGYREEERTNDSGSKK